MKLCTILGARPQFIKAATVSRVVERMDDIEEVIIHTGQHYDKNMSDLFFDELSIPKPAYQLQIGSGAHGLQTGNMLIEIEKVLLKEKPDYVLVYGDTNSTLAGALAAVKLHIPVAHVEAGLRSFNRDMPEEINRIATDHVSELLFPPTEHGHEQLRKEGIDENKIFKVGDVMLDATLFYNELNSKRQTIVDTLNLQAKGFALATIHRAENTDNQQRLKNICDALIEFSETQQVTLPLHPRTKAALIQIDSYERLNSAIQIIEPVGYLDMLALEKNASLIITDSGGVQKEAYFNHVPCITLRDETEWVELVENGWNCLCSPEKPFSLQAFFTEHFQSLLEYQYDLYGKGHAADEIVDVIKSKNKSVTV